MKVNPSSLFSFFRISIMKSIIFILSYLAVFIIQCQAACDCDAADQACLQKCVVAANDCIFRCKDTGNACQEACLSTNWPAMIPSEMEKEIMASQDAEKNKMTLTTPANEAPTTVMTSMTTGTMNMNSSSSYPASVKPTFTNQNAGNQNTATNTAAKTSAMVSSTSDGARVATFKCVGLMVIAIVIMSY
ncbi:hypothetical protein BDB01DRAFT_217013 [Pilobolus umbonatus]|nr:hypothetical protein BDB01DRAFT_217013 [Pilobolus umbonatus]